MNMVLVGAKPVQVTDVDDITKMVSYSHCMDGGTTPQNSTVNMATFDQYIHIGHISTVPVLPGNLEVNCFVCTEVLILFVCIYLHLCVISLLSKYQLHE